MMRYKKLLIGIGCAVLLGGFCGCSAQEKEQAQSQEEEIQIPIILTVDQSTGKKNDEEVVLAFNEAYEGTYALDVEWVLETEEEYRTNLKRLNVTDELPAILMDLRTIPSFYQMMVQEGRIEDLSGYIQEDPEWKDMIEPAVLEACSEPDGSIYLAPLSTAAFACSGVFWNAELFEAAGIDQFPASWEEFWDCCDTLQANGITPLALHTEGTAWAPMLLATAELADTPEGAAFMKELYPDSYQNANGQRLAATLKKLFDYTTEDALYSDFDVAYENFVSGKAAMVPNGYWMLDQIPDEFVEKVRFSPFPGNKLIASPETFGWAVVSSYSEEIKEGAVEFLKFRTAFNKEQREQLLEQQSEDARQMLLDYIKAYTGSPQIVPNYQVKWNSVLQEETFGECLPKLVKGQMTQEEFLQMADESIRQFEAER